MKRIGYFFEEYFNLFIAVINYLSFINQGVRLIEKIRKGQEIWEHCQKVRKNGWKGQEFHGTFKTHFWLLLWVLNLSFTSGTNVTYVKLVSMLDLASDLAIGFASNREIIFRHLVRKNWVTWSEKSGILWESGHHVNIYKCQ